MLFSHVYHQVLPRSLSFFYYYTWEIFKILGINFLSRVGKKKKITLWSHHMYVKAFSSLFFFQLSRTPLDLLPLDLIRLYCKIVPLIFILSKKSILPIFYANYEIKRKHNWEMIIQQMEWNAMLSAKHVGIINVIISVVISSSFSGLSLAREAA